jgi:hypothetical protein
MFSRLVLLKADTPAFTLPAKVTFCSARLIHVFALSWLYAAVAQSLGVF